MASKIAKNIHSKIDPKLALEIKIRKLQVQIEKLQNKILKLENKTLKQEQKILKLQMENNILKEEIKTPLSLMGTVVAALKNQDDELL